MFLEKLELVELSNWLTQWDKIIFLSKKKKAKWESETVKGTFTILCVCIVREWNLQSVMNTILMKIRENCFKNQQSSWNLESKLIFKKSMRLLSGAVGVS